MLQQVFRPQDEEAAVGLVQAPGPYESEVRHQGAQFRFPFDTAQQVGGRRMVFHHDGGTAELAVVHEDVDVIAIQRIALRGQGRMGDIRAGLAGLPGQEGLGVLQDVRAQAGKVLFQSLALAGLEQLLLGREQQGVQHLGHDGLLQIAFVVVEALFGLAQLAHEAGHALDKGLATPLEGHAQAVVQMFEFFLAQALALDQGVQGQAAAFVHVEMEALVLGHGGHLAQQAAADLLEAVHQSGTLLDEGRGFEAAGQFVQDGIHGGCHALLELLALTGRQGKQARPVGVIEVVDIDQVRRRRPFAGLRAKVGEQGIAAPQIGIAGNIDIIATGPDVQGHVQSLHGARLESVAAARPLRGKGISRLSCQGMRSGSNVACSRDVGRGRILGIITTGFQHTDGQGYPCRPCPEDDGPEQSPFRVPWRPYLPAVHAG